MTDFINAWTWKLTDDSDGYQLLQPGIAGGPPGAAKGLRREHLLCGEHGAGVGS